MILKIVQIKDKIIFPPAVMLIAETIKYHRNSEIIGLRPFFFKAPKILGPIVFYPYIIVTESSEFKIEPLKYCYRIKFLNPRAEIYYLKRYDKIIAINEYQGEKERYYRKNFKKNILFPYIPCPRCGINLYPDKISFELAGQVTYTRNVNYLTNEIEDRAYDIYDEEITSASCFYCGEFEFYTNEIDRLHFEYLLTLYQSIEINEICEYLKKNLNRRLYGLKDY